MTPSPSRNRWLRVVLIVVAVVVAVPVIAGGVFIWSFSGGWDGIRPEAQPTDADVVSAREDSVERTRSAHGSTVDQVLEESGGTVLASAEVDTCREGMNDWKNHDGYTLSCTRTAATAIQLPGQATTADAGRAVEERLLAEGWTPRSFNVTTQSPGESSLTSTLEESTLAPEGGTDEAVGRYRGDDEEVSLQVGISTRGITPIYLPDPVFADWYEGAGPTADVEAAFEAGTGVRVLVVNEVTYFED